MTWREQFAEEHPLLSVVQKHGVKLIGEGNERKAKCPFHQDKTRSFSINLADGSWNCFAGCGGGGVLEFLAKLDSKSADEILEDWAVKKGLKKNKEAKTQPLISVDWNACVEAFTDDHVEKLAKWRGYRPEFVRKLVEEKLIGIAEGNMAFPILAAGRVVRQRSGPLVEAPAPEPSRYVLLWHNGTGR